MLVGVLFFSDLHARVFKRITIHNTSESPLIIFSQLPGTTGSVQFHTPRCIKIGNVCWQKYAVSGSKTHFSLLSDERVVAREATNTTNNQVYVLNKKIDDLHVFVFPHDFYEARINDRGSITK